MSSILEQVLRRPAVTKVARTAIDWIDLQYGYILDGLQRLAPNARGRLLDVGCGDKPFEYVFAPFVDEYVGVEYASTYELTSAGGRNKADVQYDGDRMPFDDASFDTILNIQVLEHTPRPQHLLNEMGRVCKPGGALILIVPFSFRLHEEPHDYFRYSPHGIAELCANAGFKLEEVHPQGGLWSLIAHKVNSYLALQIARISKVAQVTGKLPHEKAASEGARVWTLPFVVPSMIANSASARVMDRVFPDPTETLGFAFLARRVES